MLSEFEVRERLRILDRLESTLRTDDGHMPAPGNADRADINDPLLQYLAEELFTTLELILRKKGVAHVGLISEEK